MESFGKAMVGIVLAFALALTGLWVAKTTLIVASPLAPALSPKTKCPEESVHVPVDN